MKIFNSKDLDPVEVYNFDIKLVFIQFYIKNYKFFSLEWVGFPFKKKWVCNTNQR